MTKNQNKILVIKLLFFAIIAIVFVFLSKTSKAFIFSTNPTTTTITTTTINPSAVTNGACGTAQKTFSPRESSYGNYTFCSSGTPSLCLIPFPTVGGSVVYQCLGSDDNNITDDATCVVLREADIVPVTTTTTTTQPPRPTTTTTTTTPCDPTSWKDSKDPKTTCTTATYFHVNDCPSVPVQIKYGNLKCPTPKPIAPSWREVSP